MTNSPDRPGDEPTLSGEDWAEYGGELIWAVDFTPGGAPAGLTSGEFCRMGDPAFDLAIVTRGVRRPFQMAQGLDRLLDAYAAAVRGALDAMVGSTHGSVGNHSSPRRRPPARSGAVLAACPGRARKHVS